MKRKISAMILSILMIFLLAGCDGGITLIESSDDEGYIFSVQVALSETEENILNNSYSPDPWTAPVHAADGLKEFTGLAGRRWTVSDYMTAVIVYGLSFDLRLLAENNVRFESAGVETEKNSAGINMKYYQFTAKVPFELLGNAAGLEEAQDPGYTLSKGFFFYRYHFETYSPFNGAREAFEQESLNISKIIKHGLTDRGVRLIPGMKDAFPAADGPLFDLNDLALSYALATNNTLRNSNGKVVYDSEGVKYYIFDTSFTEGEKKISYDLIRANSLGWNILALILGALSIAIMFLYAKFAPKKQKRIIAPPYYRPGRTGGFPNGGGPGYGQGGGRPDPFDGKEPYGNKPQDPFDGY